MEDGNPIYQDYGGDENNFKEEWFKTGTGTSRPGVQPGLSTGVVVLLQYPSFISLVGNQPYSSQYILYNFTFTSGVTFWCRVLQDPFSSGHDTRWTTRYK